MTAIVWICRNQLGRRNLTDEQKTYLIGKQYEAQKLTRGGTGANQYTTEQIHQSGVSAKQRSGNAAKIAEEHGVGEQTVVRAEKFAKGVDVIESAAPGAKEKILSGKVQIRKTTLIGKAYKAQKMSVGGDRRSEEFSKDQNGPLKKYENTAQKIAADFKVGEQTVKRAEHFLDGLNEAEKVSPGIKNAVKG